MASLCTYPPLPPSSRPPMPPSWLPSLPPLVMDSCISPSLPTPSLLSLNLHPHQVLLTPQLEPHQPPRPQQQQEFLWSFPSLIKFITANSICCCCYNLAKIFCCLIILGHAFLVPISSSSFTSVPPPLDHFSHSHGHSGGEGDGGGKGCNKVVSPLFSREKTPF